MITRIHHVAIVVRRLEEALGVYRDILGLPVGTRATVADQGVHAALLPMGDGEIELLEPTDPAGGVGRFLERRGEGLHHVCFETPDIASALEEARSANLPLIDQAPRPGLAGVIAFLHPKGNHGVLVELAQPPGSAAHPVTPPAGVQAACIAAVYVAVKDPEGAAAAYARNFGGRARAIQDDPGMGARMTEVLIGTGLVTFLTASNPGSPVARFVAERGEGLYGVCLKVADLGAALQYLKEAGIPVEVRGGNTARPLACLDPSRLHGVNLFLCPLSGN
jgi:methylmalonyl-CoA/ethylmalonyl-CoA epimerase